MKYRNEVLRDARLLKGLTQLELARATGLSTAAINMVEMGKGPWLKAIRTICKRVSLPLAAVIITGNGDLLTEPHNGSKREKREGMRKRA